MLATASHLLRRYWPELLWGLFIAANIAMMFGLTGWETVPYHNIWVSMALLFSFRLWSGPVMSVVLALVIVASGVALAYAVVWHHSAGWDEMAEIPMMTAMYLVIVMFAHRRQEALNALRETSERQRDFVRDASHHLRTPITIALGHAELIRGGIEDGQLADDAAIVVEELAKVSVISDRLLLLASAEDDRVLARDVIDVRVLVHETARRWIGAAQRNWEIVIASEGSVVGDDERLSLALDCLVENAVKATDEDDAISISCRAFGEELVLEVADSGRGIPLELKERIFDRFARGARRTRANGGGAGLGLALVKAIVEAHGGSVDVDSAPGAGATFRIRLHGFEPHAGRASTFDPTGPRASEVGVRDVLEPAGSLRAGVSPREVGLRPTMGSRTRYPRRSR